MGSGASVQTANAIDAERAEKRAAAAAAKAEKEELKRWAQANLMPKKSRPEASEEPIRKSIERARFGKFHRKKRQRTGDRFAQNGTAASAATPAADADRDKAKIASYGSNRLRRQYSNYDQVHELVLSTKFAEPDLTRGQIGLRNLGNTCFMNTALQCLSNCVPLTDYFLGYDFKKEFNQANVLGHGGVVAEAYGQLINAIWTAAAGGDQLSPDEFKATVGRVMPQFQGFAQHDVQEFLALLLDAVHEDLNRVVKSPKSSAAAVSAAAAVASASAAKATAAAVAVEAHEAQEAAAAAAATTTATAAPALASNPHAIKVTREAARRLRASARADEEAAAKEAWRGYLMHNKSIVVDLFQGQLRSSLQCRQCQHMSVTFDPFMYLSVPMPRPPPPTAAAAAAAATAAAAASAAAAAAATDSSDGGCSSSGQEGNSNSSSCSKPLSPARQQQQQQLFEPPSLERCIELFCEQESLEGENAWYCPKCKAAVPATKKLDLWKMPPVLIIHLKRFDGGSGSREGGTGSGGRSKLNDNVAFPLESLDLTRFVRSPQREPPDYDLFAVANHHGSLWGGHYTAFARSRVSGGWHQYDDSDVRPVAPAKVQSSAAYVLFYGRMVTVKTPKEESTAASGTHSRCTHHEGRSSSSAVLSTPPCSECTSYTNGSSTSAANSSSATAAPAAAAGSSSPNALLRRMHQRRAGLIRRQSMTKPHLWPHALTSPSAASLSSPSPTGMSLRGVAAAVLAAQPFHPGHRASRRAAGEQQGSALQGVAEAAPAEERESINAGEVLSARTAAAVGRH